MADHVSNGLKDHLYLIKLRHLALYATRRVEDRLDGSHTEVIMRLLGELSLQQLVNGVDLL